MIVEDAFDGVEWPAEEPFGAFGSALYALGDLDGDGSTDFVVGAPLAKCGQSQSGRVIAVSGSTRNVLWMACSEELCGCVLSSAGDVNDDGVVDVCVDANGLLVLSGADGSQLMVSNTRGESHVSGGVGDVDGDNYPDMATVFESAHFSAVSTSLGTVSVRSGATGREIGSAALVLPLSPDVARTCLRRHVAFAELPEGAASDGSIIIGVCLEGISSGSQGWVIAFDVATGRQLYSKTGPGLYGACLGRIGDRDGDGKCDIAVGVPAGITGSASDAGRVVVLSASTGDELLQIPAPKGERGFGHQVVQIPSGIASHDLGVVVTAYGEGRAYVFNRLGLSNEFSTVAFDDTSIDQSSFGFRVQVGALGGESRSLHALISSYDASGGFTPGFLTCYALNGEMRWRLAPEDL